MNKFDSYIVVYKTANKRVDNIGSFSRYVQGSQLMVRWSQDEMA